MQDIIDAIVAKHKHRGIVAHPPATEAEINTFEQLLGFSLPGDFRFLYTTCNGFECNEDIFNMSSLTDISRHPNNYGTNWFYFAEYMINSGFWGMRLLKDGTYEIFNDSEPELVLTTYLEVFLHRFLSGNVFETHGLYDWQAKVKNEKSK